MVERNDAKAIDKRLKSIPHQLDEIHEGLDSGVDFHHLFVSTMTEDDDETSASGDEELSARLMRKMMETGERDRLKEFLRDKLIQSGWRDNLKEHCKVVIKKRGLEKVTVEQLVEEITPHGRSQIPDDVRAELLTRIRSFLQSA